jgi:type I restriction enzyme M protein
MHYATIVSPHAATEAGMAIDTRAIGRERNVRYLLEGSVRRAGPRLRISAQLIEVLDDAGGKQAVKELVKQWAGLNKLQTRYEQYREKRARENAVDAKNKAQRQLRKTFDPFFAALHAGLKRLDKTVRQHEKQQAELAENKGKRGTTDRKAKALKTTLEELHKEVKHAEIFYQHIHWLQERFPIAEYEDVTGLCKLASPNDVEEQDYSLNPGRYVGVVIEEDGKTEEEFITDLLTLNDELEALNDGASQLEQVIAANIANLAGR